MKYRPIVFPQDESSHDCSVEWWYWNGRLKAENGREYAFMSCLFKTDVKKVKVPFLSGRKANILYFYHAILSDIAAKKWHWSIDLPTTVSEDSFSKPLLFVNHASLGRREGYVNCAMEETAPGHYLLRDRGLDLKLVSAKPPLLEGGKGFLDLGAKQTFYYSLTDLRAEGRVRVGDRWIEVAGKAWMDHQWAEAAYSRDKWSWFSVQLDFGTEMVCCEYEDRGRTLLLCGLIGRDGKQEECPDFILEPEGEAWTSSKTGARYPLEWRIAVPSKGIDLRARALVKGQEMVFGPLNYWEGPIDVAGKFNGKKASGIGFMELAGYPTKYNDVSVAKMVLEKKVAALFKNLKRGFWR